MSHVSRKLGQFDYFDIQLRHPSWQGKFVLDFGGNSGNILKTPVPVIEEEKYSCIDVSTDGIAEGKRTFPKANWILSDRYNISLSSTTFWPILCSLTSMWRRWMRSRRN